MSVGIAMLHDRQREPALDRIAELAVELGAADIARTARSLAQRVGEGRFYVACVGQFKRGKSTLLNALVGRSLLPAGVIPVTAVPTIIRYGEQLAARVRFRNAQWSEIPASALGEFVSEEGNPENVRGVEILEVFIPSPLLQKGMCLVDTPGVGSVHGSSTASTRAFVPHIDAAIVVIGADPPLSGDELELVTAVASEVQDLFIVLNKADRVNETDRAAAIHFASNVLQARLGRPIPTILEVSALERLEGRGAPRDWPKLVAALEDLVTKSGRGLVQQAAERGLCRVAGQLLGVIEEERDALQRPLQDSERRIEALRSKLTDTEQTLRALGHLFAAEQQRLSEAFAGRRAGFLKQVRARAHQQLTTRLQEIPSSSTGPRYRRDLMHLAQSLAHAELMPWLECQTELAENEFRATSRRFVGLANDFLNTLTGSGVPGVSDLPDEIDAKQSLRAESRFRFHAIEHVAAPASPFRLVADIVLGGVGFRAPIQQDAHRFLDHLLEVNSARVQSDVDDRIRQSRTQLESAIRATLRGAMATAERALARAATVQAAGCQAVEAACARLNSMSQQVLSHRTPG